MAGGVVTVGSLNLFKNASAGLETGLSLRLCDGPCLKSGGCFYRLGRRRSKAQGLPLVRRRIALLAAAQDHVGINIVKIKPSEGPSATQTETIGLLEKQKTDAWLKYRHEAPAQKPVQRRAKWVRPGYKKPESQQPVDRSAAEGAQQFNRRAKQRTIAAIQQAADTAEVEDILDRLGSTGMRVSMFAELIKLGDVDHSKQVLDLLHSYGVDKMVVSYNKLLSLLLSTNRLQDAEALVQEMSTKGVDPNVATYNMLLTALVNEGRLKQADYHSKALEPILRGLAAGGEGDAPQDFKFRSLILAYARRGMIAEGLALLQKHQDAGLKLTPFPYNRLLEGCAERGSLRQTEKVLDAMKAGETERDIATYGVLLGLYTKKALLPEAESVLRDALAAGLRPDVRFYTVLMAAYAERGLREKADQVLARMAADGCQPDVVTYNTLVDAYAKQGNTEGGEKVLETMEAEGISPDVVTFTTLISAWARQGKLDRAEAVLERMIHAGLEPNAFTYTALISGYAKLEMFRQANEVLDRMREAGVQPSTVTYNALLTAYAHAGLFGRAEQLLAEMESNGCPPSPVTYSVLISEYYQHGKPAAAAKLKEALRGTEMYETLARNKRRNFKRGAD